jgi:hypothetical protein
MQAEPAIDACARALVATPMDVEAVQCSLRALVAWTKTPGAASSPLHAVHLAAIALALPTGGVPVACAALRLMVALTYLPAHRAVVATYVPTVLRAMDRHATCAPVLQRALDVLWSLAAHEDTLRLLRHHPPTAAAMEAAACAAMDAHPHAVALQKHGFRLLAAVSCDPRTHVCRALAVVYTAIDAAATDVHGLRLEAQQVLSAAGIVTTM